MQHTYSDHKPYRLTVADVKGLCSQIEGCCKEGFERCECTISVSSDQGQIFPVAKPEDLETLEAVDVVSVDIRFGIFLKKTDQEPAIKPMLLFGDYQRVDVTKGCNCADFARGLFTTLKSFLQQRSIANPQYYLVKFLFPALFLLTALVFILSSYVVVQVYSPEYKSIFTNYGEYSTVDELLRHFFEARQMEIMGTATTTNIKINYITGLLGFLGILGAIFFWIKSSAGFYFFPKNFLEIGVRNIERLKNVRYTQRQLFWIGVVTGTVTLVTGVILILISTWLARG
jgi:hypothetical protein